MEKLNLKLLSKFMICFAVCTALFSFSVKPGSDSFTIYLNNKLMIQQYVTRDEAVKNLVLNESYSDDLLNINYSHCGKTGSGRTISFMDHQKKVLKKWNFSDDSGEAVSVKVGDVLALQKMSKNNSLKLVYASNELPEGRTLAVILASDKISLNR